MRALALSQAVGSSNNQKMKVTSVRSWQVEPASARSTLGEVKGFITVRRSSSGKQIQLIGCFPRSSLLTWIARQDNRVGKKSRSHAGLGRRGPTGA
jgi:hypothetical protein